MKTNITDKKKQNPSKEPVPRIKREKVRKRILLSAEKLFMEKGVETTSLSAVAEAAGFSKGAIYSNFKNKDDLCLELLSSVIDRKVEAFKKISLTEGQIDGKEKLIEEHLLKVVKPDPDWLLFFAELWLRSMRDPELHRRFAAKRKLMRTQIASLLKELIPEFSLDLPWSPEESAFYILAMSNGLNMEGMIDEKAVSKEITGKLLRWSLGKMIT